MLRRLLIAVAAACTFGSITDCNTASVFRPTQLALTPDPPVRGQPLKMTVVFNNPGAPVADGKVVTSLSLNGIPFSPSTEALCTNTECPITTGVNDRSAISTWPSTVSGKVVSKSEWFGPAGESLLCVQVKATVSTPRLRAAGFLGLSPYVSSFSSSGSGSDSSNSTATGSSIPSLPFQCAKKYFF